MQVAKYHTNYIGYWFRLVAHAATGTPNLYVGEKKGRKDSPLKGDFDFLLWIVGIRVSSQSLSSVASPIERQVFDKNRKLHTDNSVSAPASVGASKHSLRGCHRQPAPPQRQGFHPWPTVIRGRQYSFLDKRSLKQAFSTDKADTKVSALFMHLNNTSQGTGAECLCQSCG